MSIFEPPLIGPFVERNGLTGGPHTGARITWTSQGEAYQLDVIRTSKSNFWSDTLGFAQTEEINFEQFLWHYFAQNSDLPQFLRELRPFFHPSQGAPTPLDGAKWLHPTLVAHGFSSGTASARGGSVVRFPVVWLFEGKGHRGPRTNYSRVDFVDWSQDGCILLQRGDCWGTGAHALKRLFHELVQKLDGPLLTDVGLAHARKVVARTEAKLKPRKQIITATSSEKESMATLRGVLDGLPAPLTSEIASRLNQLSERSYVELLRACTRRGLERSACLMLGRRALPELSRANLLNRFVDSRWKEIWRYCAKEAFKGDSRSCNQFLNRAAHTGEPALVASILNSVDEIGVSAASELVGSALEIQRYDLVNLIIKAPAVLKMKERVLHHCFTHRLIFQRNSHAAAFHLLELGVRPLRSLTANNEGYLSSFLFDDENLPVLRRISEIEPMTEDSISKVFNKVFHIGEQTLDFLCLTSRNVPGHALRMAQIASHFIMAYIDRSSKSDLNHLSRILKEEVSIATDLQTLFSNSTILIGYGWRERANNWIDLIAYLKEIGHEAEADALKTLKRQPKPRCQSKQ